MRILGIRFQNLNSLAGTWSIDLTHPHYVADGIFAITGPTGAGKSTILDAICLGLYGTTPRLSRISANSNDIMSRHTGECFAEITFENPQGQFRCHWSQRRARGRPQGKLQQPKHEIADVLSGKPLATQLLATRDRIEAISGMSYERFVRSMLLAQGGFAAFLQAGPNDRSDILEQITGTEVYSRLSRLAHATLGEHKARLAELEARLGGIELLDEPERLTLEQQQHALEQQAAQQQAQLSQCQGAIDWLTRVEQQQDELGQLNAQQQVLSTQLSAFDAQEQRLVRAGQALLLAADHSRLQSLRDRLDADRQDQAKRQHDLPGLHAACTQAQTAATGREKQLETALRAELERREPIEQTRRHDLEIGRLDREILQQAAKLRDQTRARDERKSEQQQQQTLKAQHQQALAQARQALADSGQDESLPRVLAAMREQLQGLADTETQLQELDKALESARLDQQAAIEQLDTCKTEFNQREKNHKTLASGLAHAQQALDKTLGGQSLTDCHQELVALEAKRHALDQAHRVHQALATGHEEHRRKQHERGELESALAAHAARMPELQQQLDTLDREATLREQNLTLILRIEQLETLRGELEDGEPCPLCGASEHPLSALPSLSANEARQRHAASRNAQTQARTELRELELTVARLERDRNNLDQQRVDLNTRSTELQAESNRLASTLALSPDTLNDDGQLAAHRQCVAHQQTRAAERMAAAEACQQELDQAQSALQARQLTLTDAQLALKAAEQEQALTEQAYRQCMQARSDTRTRHQRQRQQVSAGLSPWATPATTPISSSADLAHALDELQARAERWCTLNQSAQSLQEQLHAIDARLESLAGWIDERETTLAQDQAAHHDHQALRASVLKLRHGLSGDTDPDAEAQSLDSAVQAARAAFERARDLLTRSRQALEQNRQQLQELDQAIAQQTGPLEAAETTFTRGLAEHGFADEPDFLAAHLAADERHTLEQQSTALKRQQAVLETRMAEVQSTLLSLRAAPVTQESREALDLHLASVQTELRELHQQAGALGQQLQENARREQARRQQLETVQLQRENTRRWNELNVLIGSATGTKFRNFAQGLTFRSMIAASNRQLEKMSDRYQLLQHVHDPLGLDVIDHYQGGEVRPVSNLSGGESFIVSLALALGLSHMSSRTTPVDSLFLDEGFGTLDEHALDTALETLASLNQEGKLIGVISHVHALKERISTRIEVEPVSGGRSRLTGPGCTPG